MHLISTNPLEEGVIINSNYNQGNGHTKRLSNFSNTAQLAGKEAAVQAGKLGSSP